jgi:hypothetical protein
MRTLCPGRRSPWSRRPCKAVSPAIGTAAACSKLMLSSLVINRLSEAQAYSAKVPRPAPKTASPGLKRATFLPTDFTTPDRSTPGGRSFRRQSRGLTGSCADFDQDLFRLGNEYWDIVNAEHLSGTRLGEDGGFHMEFGGRRSYTVLRWFRRDGDHSTHLSQGRSTGTRIQIRGLEAWDDRVSPRG